MQALCSLPGSLARAVTAPETASYCLTRARWLSPWWQFPAMPLLLLSYESPPWCWSPRPYRPLRLEAPATGTEPPPAGHLRLLHHHHSVEKSLPRRNELQHLLVHHPPVHGVLPVLYPILLRRPIARARRRGKGSRSIASILGRGTAPYAIDIPPR